MKVKDCKNYLAKVVDKTKDGKDIIQLYLLKLEDNTFDYEECDIKPLELDVAKKEYSIIGII